MPRILSAVKMFPFCPLLKRTIILSKDHFSFHLHLYHSIYYSTYDEPASYGCIYYTHTHTHHVVLRKLIVYK